MKINFFIVLAIIFFGSCKKTISDDKILQIDIAMSKKTNLDDRFIDSLANIYSESDYIIGMKALSLLSQDSLDQARTMLESFNQKGTFIYTAEALMYDKKNDSTKAEFLYAKALELDTSITNKWLRLYLYYHFKTKKSQYALEQLDQSINIDSNFNQAIIEKSYLLSPAENCNSIISLLSKINVAYRDDGYLSFLGDAYFYCNDEKASIRCYVLSNNIKENGFANLGLGNVNHYILGNLNVAEDFYKKSLNFRDTHCEALVGLGRLEYDKGNFNTAEVEFKKAVDSCKTQANFNELIIFYLKTNAFQKANFSIHHRRDNYPANFEIEGLSLLVNILASNISTEERNKQIDNYHLEFGDFATNWLNEVADDLNNPPIKVQLLENKKVKNL